MDELEDEPWATDEAIEGLRRRYDRRRRRFSQRDGDPANADEERSRDLRRVRRELIEAERRTVVGLRDEGRIGEEVLYRVQRDLDLEHTRLEE